MIKQFDLQKGVVRLQMGGASVQINGIYVWHGEGKISLAVVLQNDGNRDASGISVCTKIEFSEPPTTPNGCDSFFQPDGKNLLQHSDKLPPPIIGVRTSKVAIPPTYKPDTSNLYMWIKVRYSDFAETNIEKFVCRQVPAKEVFEKPAGFTDANAASFPHPQLCPGEAQ